MDIVLACDTSPYGIGDVLYHVMEDGREQPINFASRSLDNLSAIMLNWIKRGLIVSGVM